jgi:hypothetical protein
MTTCCRTGEPRHQQLEQLAPDADHKAGHQYPRNRVYDLV